MDAADASGLSKSAKKRMAEKARAERHAAENGQAAAPAPAAPKAEAKAKAKAKVAPAPAEPKAKAKAAAKGEAKAAAAPAGKAKAKAEPAPEPEPAAPAPKAKGKAKAKGNKGKEETGPEAPPAPARKEETGPEVTMDDGTGGDWEVSTGLGKKAAKQQQKRAEKEMTAMAVAAHKADVGTQRIPGMSSGNTDAIKAAAAKAGASTQAAVDAAVARCLAAAAAAGNAAAAKNAAEKGGAAVAAAPEPGSVATIKVPEKKIGIVIGPKGARIKMIQEKTGVTRIDTSGEVFTITGEPKNVKEAETAIRELIEKGYMSMEFEDFSENFVKVHPSSFPDLIGSKGAVVRKIKEELKVEVNFPDVPRDKGAAAGNKTYKVTLAGSAASVEKAKGVITNICMYYHDELTHPNMVHEELDIEQWAHRFIIGRGGSEMKHIQHNWDVKVNIPRDYSLNQNVVVVGEKEKVEKAKTYIEKLIWNAENQQKGRDKVDNEGGDTWGDEGPEEDWMKGYLYKR